MRRTLIAALIAAAGLGGSAFGITPTKVGVLTVSLANQFQGYQVGSTWGVVTNNGKGTPTSWDDHSYTLLGRCKGVVTYKSSSKKIDNAALIKAINAGLSNVRLVPSDDNPSVKVALRGLFVKPGTDGNPNPYYGGAFTTSAKLLVVNYEQKLDELPQPPIMQLPPYPPTMEGLWTDPNYTDLTQVGNRYWNAPWFYDPLGARYEVQWPILNYITWGKPVTTDDGNYWAGTKVFINDPTNKKAVLQCFDVTPFFAFDESLCYFCWDTLDRVTDGTITSGTPSSTLPPCDSGTSYSCGRSGSGTTKFYMTVKFNNVLSPTTAPAPGADNALLARYYRGIYVNNAGTIGISTDWADEFGTLLDPASKTASDKALNFSVGGVYTYKWTFKKAGGAQQPVGTMNAQTSGFGYSPMCGQFTGPVSIAEYGTDNSMFKGATGCLSEGLNHIVSE